MARGGSSVAIGAVSVPTDGGSGGSGTHAAATPRPNLIGGVVGPYKRHKGFPDGHLWLCHYVHKTACSSRLSL